MVTLPYPSLTGGTDYFTNVNGTISAAASVIPCSSPVAHVNAVPRSEQARGQ